MRDAAYDTEYTLLDSNSNIELANFHSSLGDDSKDRWTSKPLPAAPSWKPIHAAELRDGWRFGASLGAVMSVCVLLLNISLTIWGSLRSSANDGHIYHGNCKMAKQLNIGIHVIINLLSTLLLGASNYCMQCLCAPTRRDIEIAHRGGRWLDVGVQSLRNLRYIPPLKRWLWLVLGLSSLPLHLLFNSMFYATLVNRDYDIYFASEDWLTGAWYDSYNLPAGGTYRMMDEVRYNFTSKPANGTFTTYMVPSNETVIYRSDPAKIQSSIMHDDGSQFERMDLTACIDAYANSYMTDRSNVVLISEHLYNDTRVPNSTYSYNVTSNSSLYWVTYSHDTAQPLYNYRDPYGWICDHWAGESTGCNKAQAISKAAEGNWTVNGYKVSGCMSQKVEEVCSVNFTLAIGIVVILANLGKTVCIVAVCFLLTDQPLITIGDAVSSFLRTPDRSTKGCCLWTKEDVRKQWRNIRRSGWSAAPKQFEPKAQRRWKVAGGMSWAGFLLLYCASLLLALFLVIYGVTKLKTYGQGSFSAIASLGFGTATTNTVIAGDGWKVPKTGTRGIISNVLVANTPQLILSGLYLTLNNLLTRMQLAAEWASYSAHRKALRVSHDRTGAQRATYFLQLPYRLGLPLMAISATLHWLLSQSIFLASIDTWNSRGEADEAESVSTCGYSPLAIICTLIVGVLVIFFAIGVGWRRLEGSGMPLVGSHSVGIAAACHPPKDGNDETEPLKWGAVTTLDREDGAQVIGHCSFASSAVDVPVSGRSYL
ncbi:uncharacterized protein BDR25DRAFT_308058 [Lindgomyces ingoldianus]|uniref:Uncharacterized protein n=1 Tax=Lindgomyces ingoldianus TaxID=673940 RepID=A0ACB6Q9V7_9PLEO|nr:uncharacterized protein BDR25DRAFT_308058 [Lindgomyces ingoldianus]KAF2462920.1 hypothetical protein BDR25DRAFT_308058 [Lindgomyces ingoldianus]